MSHYEGVASSPRIYINRDAVKIRNQTHYLATDARHRIALDVLGREEPETDRYGSPPERLADRFFAEPDYLRNRAWAYLTALALQDEQVRRLAAAAEAAEARLTERRNELAGKFTDDDLYECGFSSERLLIDALIEAQDRITELENNK